MAKTFVWPGRPLVILAAASLGLIAIKAAPQATPTIPLALGPCTAIDGDTLRCGDRRIRLLGIDAAELPGHCRTGRDCAPGDPFAQRAALAAFARSELVVLSVGTDRYGRTLGVVHDAAGRNASCIMLVAGARYVQAWDDGLRIKRACFP